ncbi:acetyltransferase [Fusarium bulbicola]|nr:acetyltransferase [Fusarium bulbicola]
MSGTLRLVPGLSPSSVAVIQAHRNSHGQVVRLSAIDQIAPRDYISTCLFFRHSPDADKQQIFLALHRALLVTVNDIPELTCCVQKRVDSSREEVELFFDSARGVEIYYKDYNSPQLCGLWTYGNFDQLEEEHFPHSKIPRSLVFGPSAKLKDNVKLPSLIVQASFIPGGLIIGSQLHHVAGDGQCNFMLWSTIGSHFAAASCEPSGQQRSPVQLLDRHDIVKGDLNTTLKEFPHWKLAEDKDKFLNPTEYDSDEVFESATYFIPADKIAILKARILSTMPSTTKVRTVAALCAFLWRHVVLARDIDCRRYPEAKLAITVDARTRMKSPAIPSTYWGNFAEPNAVAQLPVASLLENSTLASLPSQQCTSTIYAQAALKVQKAIAAVDDKAVRRLVGLLNQMPKSTTLTWNANRYPGPDMLIVCIQHHKYNDINFGKDIGYPLATRVTVGDTEDKPDGRCLVLPPRRADSRGLEILLQYDKKTLRRLKDNVEFSEWESSWELHWEINFYETGRETSVDDGKPLVYSHWCVFVDVSSSSKPPAGYEKFLDCVATERGAEPTRVRTEFPTLRDIRESTGHQDVAQLAKRWLQTCKEHHDCGSTSEGGCYPKRLIHVGDYQNCALNTSIDVSENPHGGAFRSRNPIYLQDCYVWSPFYAPPYSSSRNEHDTGDGIEIPNLWTICAIFTADDFSWARVDLPLSNRAWVFQERLLSPRTLHFGSDRISWECGRSHNLTEYLPEGVSDDRWNGFDCLAQNAFRVRKKADLFTYYYDLVFPYTNRQLSHPNEDKLVAFAAVARRCISWFGSDYCAGLFHSTMPHCLLWERSTGGKLGRSKAYRAPSWSWASLDCRVRFDLLTNEGTVLANVVDVAVELVDPNNQFGQVKSAPLTLNGPLVASDELILKGANDAEFVAEGRPGRDDYQDTQTILGHTFGITADTEDLWDEGERKAWLISQQNMYLLAVLETSNKPHTYGLLVQKNDDGTFTRVGYWEAGPDFVSKHADTTCRFISETITIV